MVVEFYFLVLQSDPYEKHWYCDSDGKKTSTMLKNDNPVMEGFRKCELHGSKEAASSSGERTMETLSFRDAVVSLIASEKYHLLVVQECTPRL